MLSVSAAPLQLPVLTAYDVVQLIAFVFGSLWLAVTLYSLLPIVQFVVDSLLTEYTGRSSTLRNLIVDVSDGAPEDTPTIDVLVPAYDDANVVEQAIASLRKTDYPDPRLNINLLIEPDDQRTAAALDDLRDSYEFTTHVVPEAYPLAPNKPRALDYGFNETSGEVVGVIDAEDIVDPALFVHVVTGLYGENKDFVQGQLDMVNESDGWKNLLFRSEYAYWYRLLLKGFYAVGYPVPLGGTTNFFRRATLERISAIRHREYGSPWPDGASEWFDRSSTGDATPWDPRNVTEDFELGLLLWLHEFEMGYMSVTTREESPIDYTNWITQRTRWEKGKIYTLFQWLRSPPPGIRNKAHLLFQSFLPHYAAINVTGIVLLFIYSNVARISLQGANQLLLLLTASIALVLVAVHAYAYYDVSDYRPKWRRTLRTIVVGLTLPMYWILYWSATLRAMYQIYTGDLVWEKTDHHGRNDEQLRDRAQED